MIRALIRLLVETVVVEVLYWLLMERKISHLVLLLEFRLEKPAVVMEVEAVPEQTL